MGSENSITTGFIRTPQAVQIDGNGSQISISNDLSLAVTRVNGSSVDTLNIPGAFKSDGWFVYIESPDRIWTFDGIRQLDKITSSGRTSVVSSSADYPKPVWDALPDEASSFLKARIAEQGAAATP